ncbi:hypothetical protein [Staphylococcus muscae]|nr:hypothetical protein [Staphylococcus muscae]
MIPYLVSSIMLFYTYTANQSNLQKQVEIFQQSLSMTETQMHFFTAIIVLLSNILVFIFTFFLIKLLLLIFDRNKESKNEDLFFALVLGYTAANMTSLILNDWFRISFSIFMNYIPIIDLITFTSLYYFFSKSKKFTVIVFVIKTIIILTIIIL